MLFVKLCVFFLKKLAEHAPQATLKRTEVFEKASGGLPQPGGFGFDSITGQKLPVDASRRAEFE
jgi:hypothetical protein